MHAWPVTESPKFRATPNPIPLNQGATLIKCCFNPNSSTYQKNLKLSQCRDIYDRRSLSK